MLLTETFSFHLIIIEYLPTECDGGMFGQHCNQSCGKCVNNEQCHHINGSCLNGCDSGYHGTYCTEGTGNICFHPYTYCLRSQFIRVHTTLIVDLKHCRRCDICIMHM